MPCGTAAPIRSCSRWGLPCRPCCQGRGALLPHRFALARGTPCGSCAGGLFSVALSLGRPRRPLAGTVFPWSPDFPLTPCGISGRPAVWPGTSVPNRDTGQDGRRPISVDVAVDDFDRPFTVMAGSPSSHRHGRACPGHPHLHWRRERWPVNPGHDMRKGHPIAAMSRRMPNSRASVPASAWPVIASGRQWRWNARSTAASAGSNAPSGVTR